MTVIPSQRHLFDIPDDVWYLNCAYMSPLMKPVTDAGHVAVESLAVELQARRHALDDCCQSGAV